MLDVNDKIKIRKSSTSSRNFSHHIENVLAYLGAILLFYKLIYKQKFSHAYGPLKNLITLRPPLVITTP